MLDDTIKVTDDMATELIADEEEDPDYGSRLFSLTRDPLRCLLVSKGPEGVVEELRKLLGPNPTDEEGEPAGDEEPIETYVYIKDGHCFGSTFFNQLAFYFF